MLYSLPLPYIASQLGWILAEAGRQPWIVYGLLKTSDAVSPVEPSQVIFSFITMTIIYTILGIAGFYLIYRCGIKDINRKKS